MIQISLKSVFSTGLIGLGIGLAPNRWQAITWIYTDQIHRRGYAVLGGNESINWPVLIHVKIRVIPWVRMRDQVQVQ